MSRVFVAMGSNIDPELRMQQAGRALKAHFDAVRFSHCYRNAAFGFDGPAFVNAAVALSTSLSIGALLQALREIEALCGRSPSDPKWEPRAMDLDLLLYDDVVGIGPGYTLPRPDLIKRVYMLGPLAELAPEQIYPPSGPSIGELWQRFPRTDDALEAMSLDLNAA
jgi:2-amino-4-hydroxy-6-hydroxymethyldihydropteridine diphosphokinase